MIEAPALVVVGDADIVRPGHAVDMFRPPGTTHITLIERVDWLTSMVTAFLDAPMPKNK